MIDALLYSVRDGIRAAGFGYGHAECEIQDDGKPPPRVGKVFVAVHGGKTRAGQANDNNLFELYDFNVTLTMRVTIPLDRVGDQLIARNLNLVPDAQRQGFNARIEQLRAYLHMNWNRVVKTGQNPPSANDNLSAWAYGGSVYGFCEPMRYQGTEIPTLQGGDWMGAEPENEDFAIKAEIRFTNAKRFQAQTVATGVFA